MPKHYIAWWNVENLFDEQHSIARPAWMQKRLNNELKGWTGAVLDRKVRQLASVISAMNGGLGPDILGLCEVENANVLGRLLTALAPLGRNYVIRHHDSSDSRGIDIAFIVDADRYAVDQQIFTYEVLKRSATRDMVQIGLRTAKNNELIIIGNHWPARSAGQYESEPFRMMCGETLSYWLSRITEIKGKNCPVLVMGDFNDEPFNRSISEYAMASRSRERVNRGALPYLYDLGTNMLTGGYGTYVYGNEHLRIDQMLVTKGISLRNGPFDLDRSKLEVFRLQGMTKGLYDTPVRFSRPSEKSYDPDGFSDHLPLVLELHER